MLKYSNKPLAIHIIGYISMHLYVHTRLHKPHRPTVWNNKFKADLLHEIINAKYKKGQS